MNKDFIKLLIKISLFVVVIWTVFAWFVQKYAMDIYDDEYPYYKETMEYISENSDYNKVLIMGDSVAKSAVIPNNIPGKSAYNIAMAGSSPIEQYYLMQEYMAHHEKPDTILMLYYIGGINDQFNQEFFWNRTIYFNCLTKDQFNEILNTGLLPNSIAAVFNYWQYRLYSPTKYYAAAKNALFDNRRERNEKEYEKAKFNRGHHYFGLAGIYSPNNSLIDKNDYFRLKDIYEYYLFKCLDYAKEQDIKVLLFTHPINISTLANMKDGFRQDYIHYMERIVEKYPNVISDIVNDKDFHFEPDTWFGDETHLNQAGAEGYTENLVKVYGEYLIKEN